MTALIPSGGAVAGSGATAGTYGRVVAGLNTTGAQIAALAERVRSSYAYVERCAAGVDQLADQMAGLTVDTDTVSDHQEAATAMRDVLIAADQMALGLEDLAGSFSATASAHQGDYGDVADTATSMTVPMADAAFYANR